MKAKIIDVFKKTGDPFQKSENDIIILSYHRIEIIIINVRLCTEF